MIAIIVYTLIAWTITRLIWLLFSCTGQVDASLDLP